VKRIDQPRRRYLGLGTWSESSSVQALKNAIMDAILLSLKS
jgi:hypothetical protein